MGMCTEANVSLSRSTRESNVSRTLKRELEFRVLRARGLKEDAKFTAAAVLVRFVDHDQWDVFLTRLRHFRYQRTLTAVLGHLRDAERWYESANNEGVG